ncbi:hypothetical protein, partial [Clostridium sp. ZBS4]|uniref:hypothetical protein n=1 Tax=Clostridium sp. ZBS4 TaxID=2949974 RepID=UPI00207AD402
PNRKVKIHSAEGTAWETVWEIRTLPGKLKEIVVITISFLVYKNILYFRQMCFLFVIDVRNFIRICF